MFRPRPPADMLSIAGLMKPTFEPSQDVSDWMRDAFATRGGPLFDEGHSHLADARIGVLWTNVENRRAGRVVLGQTELVERIGRASPFWVRERAHLQLAAWFPKGIDFLITLDAAFCDRADDMSFAALVDHELCHCGKKLDDYGSQRFDRITGKPLFTIRGHDVEEFVSVVARFGAEASGDSTVDLVIAAASAPSIGPAKLALSCGTCLRIAA